MSEQIAAMKTLWREAEAQLHKWKDEMDEMKAAAAAADPGGIPYCVRLAPGA